MKHTILHRSFLFASAAVLAGVLGIAGCHLAPADAQASVYKALDSKDFASVMVSQNRETGVITLTGIVGAADRKSRAEAIAKQAAPSYTIVDNIRVDSSGL
ncbi:MAG: hypothetical protein ABSF53_01600 [Terracidiphilus sp.]|jgi:hypothetical protein